MSFAKRNWRKFIEWNHTRGEKISSFLVAISMCGVIELIQWRTTYCIIVVGAMLLISVIAEVNWFFAPDEGEEAKTLKNNTKKAILE